MTDLLIEQQDRIFIISFNRSNKNNAFDDTLLKTLQTALEKAIEDTQTQVIVLNAKGRHFSAGADIHWMQRMAEFTEAENVNDAMILARVMYTLNQSPKPTIAVVQGAAFGGGAGLAAACDIVIAATTARFCFSEVKLGLIPAVISPYVIQAIGARAAKWLFMTAETIDATQAKQLQLVHHCVAEEELSHFSLQYAKQITKLAPEAVRACKKLITQVKEKPINEMLLQETAELIAKKRASVEGQQGLRAFINKETPHWD